MNYKQNKLSMLIVLIIALTVTVYAFSVFNASVAQQLDSSVVTYVNTIAMQQELAINNEVNSKIMNLYSVADTLAVIGEDDDYTLTYLAAMQERYGYETLSIANFHGDGVFADGQRAYFGYEEYFEEVIGGTPIVTEPYLSPSLDIRVITAAVPIDLNGEVVGIAMASYAVDYFEQEILNFATGKGNTLIVNIAGEVIMATGEELQHIEKLESATFNGSASFEKLMDDFATGTRGTATYTLDGQTIIAEYRPVALNNWMLFYFVPQSYVQSTSTIISKSVVIFTAIMFALFAGILMYSILTRNRYLKLVEKSAYYDELTGLPNLVKLKKDMRQVLEENTTNQYAVVKMDIANFKAINELYSFDMGNKVLKCISETAGFVKEPTLIVARIGPDEFILFASRRFLDNFGNTKKFFEDVFRKILSGITDHSIIFRFGRYFIEPGDTDVDDIVNKVSMAHSFTKTTDGESLCDYDDTFKKQSLLIAEITNKMHGALKHGEFKVFLQPKFSILNEEMIGAEALVRWDDGTGAKIFPNVFIPMFEANGFVTELDKYMLENVCKTIRSWLDKGYKCVAISVNFSRIHLQNPNFVSDLVQIVKRQNVPTSYIEIELTETTITENEGEIDKLLSDLHEAGFTVSIDDFGAGYSSLGMLKNFKVDTLKLDRSFFVNNKYDERGDLVIDGIIQIAHSLDMKIVAEGVEEPEQIEFLKKVNCEAAQGYYYAKPMPAQEFEELYFKGK